MSVVSDCSPLINLARIGRLGLFARLYGELVVPEAVWCEVIVAGFLGARGSLSAGATG